MCELVCVFIINVLFINITMRSKFCSYLCILSRDHYIYIYIYIQLGFRKLRRVLYQDGSLNTQMKLFCLDYNCFNVT